MAEDSKVRREAIGRFRGDYLGKAEVAIYYLVGVLLAITAAAALVNAGRMLWTGFARGTLAAETLRVLDQLLIVLMLVEILHTVRISIRSHIFLAMEPFLVVGLIASIRRVLIISLQMTGLAREGGWSAESASIFKSSMIEFALLVALIPVLVFSITLLRRHAHKEMNEGAE
jgi:Phosphate-starvation-inducible E family